MKTALLTSLALFTLAAHLQAQGLITFANNDATAVTNSLTGQRVVAGTTFRAALYAAPDGTMDESQFVPVAGPIGFTLPGIFNGGPVSIPLGQGGAFFMCQVRVFEAAYGATYEQADAAPAMDGRTALLGKSNLMRALLAEPPSTPQNLPAFGLTAIVLRSRPVPSLSINDLVVSEGTNGTVQAVFTVTLQPSSLDAVTVDYATEDGSALAEADYLASSGTLEFAPGETTRTVSVTVTADMPAEPDEEFYVNLSNAVNAPIARGQGRCLITEVRIAGLSLDVAVSFNTVASHRYRLEKTDDLVTWTTVAGAEDVPGTGVIVTVYDRGAGCQPLRLYRAQLLE